MEPQLPKNFDTFFNINFMFSLIIFMIWLGYSVAAFTMIGKVNELSQTLETKLSSVIKLATFIHFLLIVVVGVVAMLLLLV